MHKCYDVELGQNWVFKEKKDDEDVSALQDLNVFEEEKGWKSVHKVPSEIHVELLKRKEISDPYVGFNEHNIQCEFSSRHSMTMQPVDMVAKGLENGNGSTPLLLHLMLIFGKSKQS